VLQGRLARCGSRGVFIGWGIGCAEASEGCGRWWWVVPPPFRCSMFCWLGKRAVWGREAGKLRWKDRKDLPPQSARDTRAGSPIGSCAPTAGLHQLGLMSALSGATSLSSSTCPSTERPAQRASSGRFHPVARARRPSLTCGTGWVRLLS
jgi:hypothetical protein